MSSFSVSNCVSYLGQCSKDLLVRPCSNHLTQGVINGIIPTYYISRSNLPAIDKPIDLMKGFVSVIYNKDPNQTYSDLLIKFYDKSVGEPSWETLGVGIGLVSMIGGRILGKSFNLPYYLTMHVWTAMHLIPMYGVLAVNSSHEDSDLIKLSYLVVSVAINLLCNKKMSLIQSVFSAGLMAYNYTQSDKVDHTRSRSEGEIKKLLNKTLAFDKMQDQTEKLYDEFLHSFKAPKSNAFSDVIKGIVYSYLLAHVYSSKSNAAISLGLPSLLRCTNFYEMVNFVLQKLRFPPLDCDKKYLNYFITNFILSLNGKDELSESLGIQKQLPLLNFHLISFTRSQIIKMVARESLGLDHCSEKRVWVVLHLALQILMYKKI